MRLQIITGDRRRAEFVALVIARLAAIALLALALLLAGCCTPAQRSSAFTYPYAPVSIDVSKCQARRATYAVRQAFTFRGVSYPPDSMLLRDSVVDLDACRRGGSL